MHAIVLDGRGAVDLCEVPEPEPLGAQLLVAPQAVGICGTDLHLVSGDYPTGRFPVVPGHEFAGVVVAAGPQADGFVVGDRVGVDPNVSCGGCRMCRRGLVNLCEGLDPIGVTVDGACAQLVVVPSSVAFRLPDGIDWATAALIEPLACVLHAASRIGPVRGQRVLIYGAGSIGLLATAWAKAEGAAGVTVVEPSRVRQEAALELGADDVHGPGGLTGERVADLVIEAAGHRDAVADALVRLDNRGTLLQMGVVSPKDTVPLTPYDLFDRELTLIGSQSLATSYGEAVRRIGDFPGLAQKLVTHTFGLADYGQALRAAGSEGARKVHVLPQQ